jgi:hypothetical protein
MITITDNETAAQAKYALEQALLDWQEWRLLAAATELTLSREQFEFSVEWGKLIFAWWNDEHSQSWRVTGYEIERAEIRLRVTRAFERELATLVLRDAARWREQQAVEELSLTERRQLYLRTLPELLKAQFAELKIERCSAPKSGHYLRLVLRHNRQTVLAIGVNEGEAQSEIDAVLANGLVWLSAFNQRRKANEQAAALWFCLPATRAETTLERLTLLDATRFGTKLGCLLVDEREQELASVRIASQTELLNTHPRTLRWPATAPINNPWRERIVALAPELIEVRHAPQRDGEVFLLNGLEFARVGGRANERASFGVAGLPEQAASTRLTEANFGELAGLVRELARQRAAVAADRRAPFYRLRAEAWLEALLRRDLRVLDATIDERFVYSQIPAWRADERVVLDLLTVNLAGRLIVIEIKASEDLQLPLQGLDYWLRVEQARLRNEFAQRGLFAGVTLAEQAPLLYLVAPRLRFHRSFNTVARFLSPQLEAYRIGINADWRAGVRVYAKERINVAEP